MSPDAIWTQPPHVEWLVDTGRVLELQHGLQASVLRLDHVEDDAVLDAWASHMARHYGETDIIDTLRSGTGLSRGEYLETIKFPSAAGAPGPSIRAGDFAEILLADYVQWMLGYWVPRVRWSAKSVRNESAKGTDLLGFVYEGTEHRPEDRLVIVEVKSQLVSTTSRQFESAIKGSAKDKLRLAETLNATKQRLLDTNQSDSVRRVQRFQSEVDRPYTLEYRAAVVFSSDVFDEEDILEQSGIDHPHRSQLSAFVIIGDNLMPLVHRLYERAVLVA